jgi:nucleoside-triphosphatase
MTIILTGSPGEGKTTFIKKLISFLKTEEVLVSGIFASGTWKDGVRDSFNVVDIETGQHLLLCDHMNTPGSLKFRHFFFKPGGIEFGLNSIKKGLTSGSEVLIIDEIGGFELVGGGWYPVLTEVIRQQNLIRILVVRRTLVNAVIKEWNIDKPQIIDVNDRLPISLGKTIKNFFWEI